MNSGLTESEDRAATRSEGSGLGKTRPLSLWVGSHPTPSRPHPHPHSIPAPALLSSHFPTLTRTLLHRPLSPSFRVLQAHPGGGNGGFKSKVRAAGVRPGPQASCSSGRSGADDPCPGPAQTPECFRELGLTVLDSTSEPLTPKLDDPGKAPLFKAGR